MPVPRYRSTPFRSDPPSAFARAGESALNHASSEMVDGIAYATRTIEELTRRGEAMREEAENTIQTLRRELEYARKTAEQATLELEIALEERARVEAQLTRRVHDLTAENVALADELQALKEDYYTAEQIQQHVRDQIQHDLTDAIRKAEAVIRDPRRKRL